MLKGYIFLLASGLMLFSQVLWAQTGFALRFQPKQVGSTHWQPALLPQQQAEGGVSFGFDGDYSLGTNSLPFNLLQFTDTFLEQGEKDRILGELGTNNQLRAGFMLGGRVHFNLGKVPLSVSFRRQQNIFFQIPNAQTLGLVLNGNRPYAGSPVSDENVRFQNLQWDEYGIGTGWKNDKVSLGLSLKLLQGNFFNQMQRLNYSFLTALDGTSIDISADYEAFSFDQTQNHFGIGVDAGILFQANDRLQIGLSAVNLSRIWWRGSQFNNQVSFFYEGIEIGSLLNVNLQDINDFFVVDTVQALFVPDSMVGTFPAGVGGSLQAQIQYKLNNGGSFWSTIQYGLNPFADGGTLPFFVLGYQQQINKSLLLGTHFYGGGMEQFGWGIFGQYELNWGERQRVALFLAFDNSMGAILPTLARGVRANGGLSLRL
ncbi:MAG: DUF5723 family protein [Bacteroidota bacterium]